MRTVLDDTSDTDYDWASVAPRYGVIVLNSWDYGWIPAIKAANPDAQVWVYKDLASTRSDECTGGVDWSTLATGVGYCDALEQHPSWFLDGPDGQPYTMSGYPTQWTMDYGNPAYQQAWVQGVLGDVEAHGWDGVEMDNAETIAGEYGTSPKYPTDQAVQAAMYSMLETVGPQLQAAGVTCVANVGYAPEFQGLWQTWLGPVSGLMQEFFLSWSSGQEVTGSGWQAYEDELTSAVARHKMIYAHVGSWDDTGDQQIFGYGLASFLLGTDGNSAFGFGDSTLAQPTYAERLGPPTGSAYSTGDGTYARQFTNGTVEVDTNAGSGAIRLGSAALAPLLPVVRSVGASGDGPVASGDGPVASGAPSAGGAPAQAPAPPTRSWASSTGPLAPAPGSTGPRPATAPAEGGDATQTSGPSTSQGSPPAPAHPGGAPAATPPRGPRAVPAGGVHGVPEHMAVRVPLAAGRRAGSRLPRAFASGSLRQWPYAPPWQVWAC